MTYSVYIRPVGKDAPVLSIYEEFIDEFKRRHTHPSKLSKFADHGVHVTRTLEDESVPPLFEIICHWDFDHMVKTANTAAEVLKDLCDIEEPLPTFSRENLEAEFGGYEFFLSW